MTIHPIPGGKLEQAYIDLHVHLLIFGGVRSEAKDVLEKALQEAYESEVAPQIMEHIAIKRRVFGANQ